MTTDEALSALLADLESRRRVSTTLDALAQAWTLSPAATRKRLQRWEERGHITCAWPGGGQVTITSNLSTVDSVDTSTEGNLSTVDTDVSTRGQANDIKGLTKLPIRLDAASSAVDRHIARYVDSPVDTSVDSRGHADLSTLSTVDTPTPQTLSTASTRQTPPSNVVLLRTGSPVTTNLAVREEEIRGLFQQAAEAVQPNFKVQVPLSRFRPSNWLRLVSAGAVAVSITMIAFHSAGSSAASAFHWWATLAMAVILSTGKVVAGSQAERSFADGDRLVGWSCVVGAVFLLCVDASLLYAFRGDSLSNAAAIEKAAMEQRARVQIRLDGLVSEQQRLQAAAGAPINTEPVRLVGEVEADLAALEHDRDCRLIQPKARRGEPKPAKVPANEAACEKKRAVLQGELARAEEAAGDETRARELAAKRDQRLVELPGLIGATEAELGRMQARATPDHGASIVARGLNWLPAGVTGLFGFELRPVEGRGVEIFWSWAFVLAAELFAVGGFAIAARADRKERKRV